MMRFATQGKLGQNIFEFRYFLENNMVEFKMTDISYILVTEM